MVVTTTTIVLAAFLFHLPSVAKYTKLSSFLCSHLSIELLVSSLILPGTVKGSLHWISKRNPWRSKTVTTTCFSPMLTNVWFLFDCHASTSLFTRKLDYHWLISQIYSHWPDFVHNSQLIVNWHIIQQRSCFLCLFSRRLARIWVLFLQVLQYQGSMYDYEIFVDFQQRRRWSKLFRKVSPMKSVC